MYHHCGPRSLGKCNSQHLTSLVLISVVLPFLVVIPHFFLLLYPFEVDCQPTDPVAGFSPRNIRKDEGEVRSVEQIVEELQ